MEGKKCSEISDFMSYFHVRYAYKDKLSSLFLQCVRVGGGRGVCFFLSFLSEENFLTITLFISATSFSLTKVTYV